jgi:hypothetical protein
MSARARSFRNARESVPLGRIAALAQAPTRRRDRLLQAPAWLKGANVPAGSLRATAAGLVRVATYVRRMKDKPLYPVPAPDHLKDLNCIGCSDPACPEIAPFTIHEWEQDGSAAQLAAGWQLRLIFTQVISDEGPAQSCRFDFYCPAHSGEWNPRQEGTWRVSVRED